MAQANLALRPFYIYDPNVPDTLGGLQVKENDKGKFVLATPQMIQYWVDQGLLGDKPFGEISGAGKKLLSQITRGRSDDNNTELPRLPKYAKQTQSGAPAFALQPLAIQRKKRQRDSKKDVKKRPELKSAPTPAPAPPTAPKA
jgi:hypothetical protein